MLPRMNADRRTRCPRRHFSLITPALALLWVGDVAGAAADAPAPQTRPAATRPAGELKVFDGKPNTIVTITNSHRGGGKEFERKVVRYFAEKGEKSPITFRGTGGWQTPVDPVTGEAEKGSWLEKLNFDKERAFGNPVVVIALCGVTMPRPAKKGESVPVNDETVAAGVRRCENFVKALELRGADEVFLSSYHYFEEAASPNQRFQYEPEYTLKVYEQFNERTGDHYAIDCLTLTKQHHPLGVGDDQFHTSDAGHAVYAQCWFEALLKHDGLDVPAWSREEMDAALNAARAKAADAAPATRPQATPSSR